MPATDHPARQFALAELTVIPPLIRAGDVLPGPHGWAAIGNARDARSGGQDGTLVPVRYTADGGHGERWWPLGAAPIAIQRKVPR